MIERKNLVWPPDYAVGHNNDHFLADRITDGLRDHISDDAYEIQLDFCVSGSSEELETFAQQIVETVRASVAELRAGAVAGKSEPGRRWRFFRGEKGLRALENAPETGLGFHWDVPTATELDASVPPGLLDEVSRLFSACARKFESYLDARRIVIIEQHGDFRHQGAWWWKQIIEGVPPPYEIDELWDGMFDWLDDYERGCLFEKLYPLDTLPSLASPPQSTSRSTFEAETSDAS